MTTVWRLIASDNPGIGSSPPVVNQSQCSHGLLLGLSSRYSTRWSVSTRGQLLYSDLHGTAMRYAAEKRDLAESTAELHELADVVMAAGNRLIAGRSEHTATNWSPVSRSGALFMSAVPPRAAAYRVGAVWDYSNITYSGRGFKPSTSFGVISRPP